MIQRIQSVFMAVAAICVFGVLFTDIWVKQGVAVEHAGERVVYNAFSMVHTNGAGEAVQSTNTLYVAGLALLSAVLFVASIFSYRNRMKQITLNLINTLVLIGLLITNILLIFQGTVFFETNNQGNFAYGFYLPIVALFMNVLANRFIRKDELLVRSADRIR